MVIQQNDNFNFTMKGKLEQSPNLMQNNPHRRDSGTLLSDYYSDNEPNDLDFNEVTKIAQYREAIEIIQRKCEALSKDNEKLVRRLHCVKKIAKRKEKDVAILKNRLDQYSDEWRTAQPESHIKNGPSLIAANNCKPKKNKVTKKEKVLKTQANKNVAVTNEDKSGGRTTKATKKKRVKCEKEKDPNAPKRPANPFFQFCQDKRSILMDELNSELQPGQPELSKQELTRQLAIRWRTMDTEAKQIYINKYNNSKQKYNQEMETYKRDGVDKLAM